MRICFLGFFYFKSVSFLRTQSSRIGPPLSTWRGRRALSDQGRSDGVHPLHQLVLRARGALQRQRHVTRLLHLKAEELLVGARREQEVVIPARSEASLTVISAH